MCASLSFVRSSGVAGMRKATRNEGSRDVESPAIRTEAAPASQIAGIVAA